MSNTPPSTYNLTAGQLATSAYRKLGLLDTDDGPTDAQFEAALEALNLMIKGWQADGINLFRQTQLSIAVPALGGGPNTPISIVPRIMQMESARWVVTPGPNSYERPLGMFPYEYYWNLPNKLSTASSGPSSWTIDLQPRVSNLYLWPVPTFSGTLNATVARTMENVESISDEVLAPSEWGEGLVYTLADRLMDENAVGLMDPTTAERVSQRAADFYDKLLNYDRPTSVIVKPWGKAGQRRYWS